MRKVILVAVFLCLTIGVSFGQFSTGTNTVSGTISYSTYSDDGEDGVSILLIAPTGGRFVTNNLAILLGLQYMKFTYPRSWDQASATQTGYLVGAKYFVNNIYGGASFVSSTWEDIDANTAAIVEAGYLYGFNEHVFLDAGIDYEKGLGDDKSVVIVFGLGISAFF